MTSSSERGVYAASTPSSTGGFELSRSRFAFAARSGVNAALLLLICAPHSALACAACYGQSDSSLAQGLKWGVLGLLGVVVPVLGGIAAFFIFIVKRAAAISKASPGDI